MYDNFEQVERVKSQCLENNSTFFSVTTGEVLQGVDIPPGGLRQDMFDKTVQLGINDVLFTPGNKNDELENDVSESNLKVTNISTIKVKLQSLLINQLQISRYFITEAISHAFPDAVNEVFASAQGHRPSMPSIDILPCRKTDHRPLGSIPHDESSNAGTLAVLENICRGQYRLQEDAFTNALLLIYGDQKTVQRIRTCKRRRRGAARAYDSLKWALPIPAFFHLKMNLLYMISNCHFGGQGREQSTLYYAMNLWGRKKISAKKAEFLLLKSLLFIAFRPGL